MSINENYDIDSLTNTLNKAGIIRCANEYIESNTPFSLVFIDFDNFKSINDILGHQIGDEALKLVAKQIIKTTNI